MLQELLLVWVKGDDIVGRLDTVMPRCEFEGTMGTDNNLKLVIERVGLEENETILEALILDTDSVGTMLRAVKDVIDYYHHQIRVHIATTDEQWVRSLDEVKATVWSIDCGSAAHNYRGQYRYLLDWAGIASEY